MKQLSSPLQQYWPTVVGRLPAAISESSLSVQAKSVLTFSDFVRDSIIAHPEWLVDLESAPLRRMNGNTMPTGYSKHWPTSAMKTR